jgi:ABC-type dipeptide/oligopeptide/nickel transport system permease component
MQFKQPVLTSRIPRFLSVLALAICGLALVSATAQACPMCSQSIAEEDLLPHAYMYSILFMLGMPATVFGGIGTAIFLKYRKYAAQVPAMEPLAEIPPVTEPNEHELAAQA